MCIGRVVDADLARARGDGGVGLEDRDDAGDWADADASSGRGKKKDKGFQYNFERSGGFRTFRYMFSERSARLACGTYLAADQTMQVWNVVHILVCVRDLLRVHPTGEYKYKCSDTHK